MHTTWQTWCMAFHHVAITTRDLEASNRFYTDAMGFELVKVDVIPFLEGGWARHLFYDTGNGELIALWDLHYDDLGDFDPAISTGLGLPNFVNHIAFGASDLDDIDARKDRLLANGHDVVRIDHGWCVSIYADDPSGIMVEFCTTTGPPRRGAQARSPAAARRVRARDYHARSRRSTSSSLHATTPASRNRAISAASHPATSRSTSSVCAPSVRARMPDHARRA